MGDDTTNTQRLEDALIDAIEKLSESEQTGEVQSALLEAERYRDEMSVWEAEPPGPMIMSNTLSEVAQLLGRVLALAPRPKKKRPKSAPKLELELDLSDTPGMVIGRVHTAPGLGPGAKPPRAERTGTMVGVGGQELSAVAGLAAPAAVRIHSLEWRNAKSCDGVSIKVLHEQRIRTVLVHIAEQTELPSHRHQTTETIYVIDGSVFVGDTRVDAEETCTFLHDTVSPAIRSDEGAVLLLMNSDRPGLAD